MPQKRFLDFKELKLWKVHQTECLNFSVHHYLLKAAAAFLHTAELLLKGESNQTYLNEKLMQGASGLADALIEMQKD
jgi:hypothetical protein